MKAFSQKGSYELTINIGGLKNNAGVIALQLYDHTGNLVKGKIAEINNKSSKIIIDNLSHGVYSVRYYHDENHNNQLDCNWMNIPTETYGFSNNATARFGTPPLKDREFELDKNLIMNLKPKY